MRLEHFVEALQNPESGLTVPVLTGSRKQSVIDAERLFSPELAMFIRAKGYTFEADYIETVWNWRCACDHRGLTELQRCHFNESTEVQNPRRNSYTQTMDVCITPCTVDISVDSPALFVG